MLFPLPVIASVPSETVVVPAARRSSRGTAMIMVPFAVFGEIARPADRLV